MFKRATDFIASEPVATAGVLTAGIACGTAFGLHWSPEQVAGVTGLWAAISALFVRSRVTPTP